MAIPFLAVASSPDPPGDDRAKFTPEDRAWWSFQPVEDPAVPEVRDGGWSRTPIDRFIFRKLQENDLTPAPEADRRTLLRRACFDLTGLPPTEEQVEAFLSDDSPGAYERMIDRLLESPRYGERWGRHWLDVVRYAESDGWRADHYRPNAWRYRDYVIRSFNEDKPYDRFVREQLAGDEIAPGDPDAIAATGFLRLGIYEYNQRDAETQRDEILDEITDVTGDVFMGMGMACARCHDHKFDPILQKDYYRLQAFFEPLLWRDGVPMATPEERAEYEKQRAEWEEMTAEIREKIEAIEKPHREAQVKTNFIMFTPELQAIYNKPAEERTSYEEQIAYLIHRQALFEHTRFQGRIKDEERERWTELKEELAAYDEHKPQPLPPVMSVSDTPQPPAPTQVGDTKEEIGPGFLTLLSPGPAEVEPTEASPDSTGRRTALARWLTDPDNPLTARVMVNRIWQYHFGEGLAAASNDFGRLGEKPSHPELLDYLATRFVEGGWSIKAMHRRIMNSAVYRQSATHPRPEAAAGKDPGNRLRWRAEVHRLDAEQVRDAMLVAGGELDLSMGGPSVNGDRPRRSVYTRVRRNRPDPLLHAFDAVGGFTSTPQRNVTTTATQALLMINGDWPLSQAKAMADRLREMELGGDEARVAEAYRLAFGRPPESTERAEAVAFLDRQADRMIEEQQRADPATGVTGTVPSRSGRAARLEPGSEQDRLEIPDHPSLPEGDFTVEAVIFLDSLYGDATVRTIISQWDNNHSTPGWAFGVTSEQSAYEPRNLILQLVGDTAGGERTYEVIASNLRPELNTPYYVAVSVDLDRTEEGGVTFYMKNLSSDDAKLHAAFVPHKVRGSIDREGVPVVIGGRDGQDRHLWDGLIDDVRISNTPLPREQLLLYDDATADETAGFWRFEDRPGFYKDSSGRANHIRSGAEPGDIRHAALIDLCHALLNANEFLYVD